MRLIDADSLIDWIDCGHLRSPIELCYSEIDVIRMLNERPTVDAEPVRHGRWVWKFEDVYMCESCGEKVHVKEVMGKPDWSYCPNCGAKMSQNAAG